jgi:hypothetical protein
LIRLFILAIWRRGILWGLNISMKRNSTKEKIFAPIASKASRNYNGPENMGVPFVKHEKES